MDRGSVWCYRVRCEVQGGGALVGLVTPLFLFLALWGRPRADPAVGDRNPRMFGRHLRGGALVLSELFFGQGYLVSPFHLPLSPSGDPRWFQYGGLFNFVAPGGRRAQRGVGANWLVLGSRGYIRRSLLLLLCQQVVPVNALVQISRQCNVHFTASASVWAAAPVHDPVSRKHRGT